MKHHQLIFVFLAFIFAATQVTFGARGRPTLNSARTSFVADDGQLLRGPATGTEYGGNMSWTNVLYFESRGCNMVHLYAEDFVSGYAAGTMAQYVDQVVAMTRTNGMYLIITIANSWANGSNSLQFATNFWNFYAPRYANETHVIYEIHNEPVAWGPPYSSSSANPPGALNMEEACYRIIRAKAPYTPVLLFTYSVLSGSGGASAALTDIQTFNTDVFGNANAVWQNEAVAFHGYAGDAAASAAASQLIAAGYPCFQTEFIGGIWGSSVGALDVYGVVDWERLGISWSTFQFDMSDEYFKNVVNYSGLSWTPDFGNWPPARGPYGNGGYPWTTPDFNTNNVLTGTLHIEAENFDNGGKNVAYYNGNRSNPGGQYRTGETVGIEATTDTGGGYNIGWISAGDWWEYTIKVSQPGYYNLALRVAGTSAGQVQLLAGGVDDLTGQWTLPNTGGWQTWTTVAKSVFLKPGQQRLRISALAAGFNLNWIEISPVSSGPIANGTYKFLNAATGLTPTGVTGNGTIIDASYSGSAYQQWNLQNLGAGQYQITCAANGYSLTGSSGFYWWNGEHFIVEAASGGNFRLQSAGGFSLESPANSPTNLDEAVYSGAANQQWAVVSTASSGGTVKLLARHSGLAMAASGAGTTDGTQIIQWTYYGGTEQQWTVTDTGSGYYKIMGVGSGKSLDIDYSSGGTANGTKVQLWDYWNGPSQQFNFIATDSGCYRISPNCATNSCLDVTGVSTSNGATVQLWTYGGGQNQQWLVQPVDGTVKLVARHSGKVLDAYGAQTANGTQLIQWAYGSGANQQWTVTDTGNGYYKIIGVGSGKSLDIDYSSGGTANGTKVQLWDYWNGPSQQFNFIATVPGYFRITPNCATGSCLDVSGVSTADGANVQLWQWVGGQNQQWAPQAP